MTPLLVHRMHHPELPSGRTEARTLVVWSMAILVLVWIGWLCLLGRVEHTVSGRQISGTGVVGSVLLPGLIPMGPGTHLELFEEGRPLGPEVEDPEEVREVRGGSYAVGGGAWPGLSDTRVFFSATDRTRPRLNGRRYTVRYPRRQLPAALALLLGTCILVPLVALRHVRSGHASPLESRSSPDSAAWSLLVIGAFYAVFAAQASSAPSNVAWLLALVGIGLPPFLMRLTEGRNDGPTSSPWLAGLVAWAACTALAGTSYASRSTAAGFVVISVAGLVLYFGLRGALARLGERRARWVEALLVVSCSASLARDAGFDPAGFLASMNLASVWPLRLVNPWTTKFLGHWLLVVLWCSLVARDWNHRKDRWRASVLLVLAIVVVGLNGSKSAAAAFLASIAAATAALRWPGIVRRTVVYGLVAGLLLAPLLASVPWRVQAALSERVAEGPLDLLEMDVRGGVWEFSRRLISYRPLLGWGFGASGNLPGRQLPIANALGVDTEDPRLARHPVLAGGHPHNAALLTWLDLGLVGALLVAGLIWAIGRSIAAVEERRGTHAALLGLLTVTATYLAFNYPAWEPEVMSILWMTAVLAAAVLPEPAVPRRTLLRSGAAVLLILAVGGSILAWDRADRWWTAREVRDGRTVLDAEAGRIVVGGEALPLEHGGLLDAGAEFLHWESGGTALMRGWAYGPPGAGAPDSVLVFVGSELAGVVWPELPSPEAFARSESRDVRALVSGFLLRLQPDRLDLEEPVTVVALRPGGAVATELPPLAAARPEKSQVP